MHALRDQQIRWIGTPVGHSKLTVAMHDCFPGGHWEFAPGLPQFAGYVRRVMVATCALWDGRIGRTLSAHYSPDGLASNLATSGARCRIGGVGRSSQVVAMLRKAMLNPLRRGQSWSFVALMGLTGEPWRLGKPLIGKASVVPSSLHVGWELRHGDTIISRSPPLMIDVAPLAIFDQRLKQLGIGRRLILPISIDWCLDRIRDSQAEETVRRHEWGSQAVLAWRSKCAKSLATDSMRFLPRRCEFHRSDVVVSGGAASGYRGVRHT